MVTTDTTSAAEPAIDATAKTGSGTVDGTPVTLYQVSNNLDQLAGAAGTTSAESQTVSAALALLEAQGYTAETVKVSIDGTGYIHQVTPTRLLENSLRFDRTGDDRYGSDEGQDVGRSRRRANSRECRGHNEH